MTREEHASRLWSVLVEAALNRQTLTYKLVASRTGIMALGLAHPLGYLMRYCHAKGLPPITVLVVSSDNGKPGEGLGTSGDFDRDRERVFAFTWSDHPVPSPDELRDFAEKKISQ